MPLGSFRLNSIAKRFIATITDWSAWDGSKDGNQSGFDSGGTQTAFAPVDDTYGIITIRDGATGQTRARPLLRSGNVLSLGGSSWIDLGVYNEDNDGLAGRILVSTDKTFAYYVSNGGITRINNLSSSGNWTASNRLAINTDAGNEYKQVRLLSDGKIAVFRSGNLFSAGGSRLRHDFTLSGTTTISITNTQTTELTNLPAAGSLNAEAASITPISDTQYIIIFLGASHQSAWLATRGNSTATQIGSTFTDTLSARGIGRAKYICHDLDHNYGVAWGINSSVLHHYYIANSTSFTKFTISNPGSLVVGSATMDIGTGYVSLDNSRFMVKHNSSNGFEYFWIVNRQTQTIQTYIRQGDSWEETSRSHIRRWNSTSVFSGNWRFGRVLIA